MAKHPATKESEGSAPSVECDVKGCSYTAKITGAITAHWNKVHRKPHAQKRGSRKRSQDRGRPSVLTSEVVGKLVEAFENGMTVSGACGYAGISTDPYYDRMKKDRKFADKMNVAQAQLGFRAREVVAEKIKAGDEKTAMWWLERRASDEFSTRKEVTGKNGGPIKTESKEIIEDEPVTEQELEQALFGDDNKS